MSFVLKIGGYNEIMFDIRVVCFWSIINYNLSYKYPFALDSTNTFETDEVCINYRQKSLLLLYHHNM
jgi:hypothetical protein